MTPAPLRLTRIRRIALRLAERGELTGESLARAATISRNQAWRWITLLEGEGAIVPLGSDPDQVMGRPRMLYGRKGE